MVETDLSLMHRWLNQGEVLHWYAQEPQTCEDVERAYGPRLGGQSDVLSLIAEYDEVPIGYVQRYFTRDHPDFWGEQDLADDTAGIDLFIGEERFQHRGLGYLLVRAMLREVVFGDESTGRCIIDPFPDNAIAIRAYEKAGFRYLRTLLPPEHVDPCYLMVIEREDVR